MTFSRFRPFLVLTAMLAAGLAFSAGASAQTAPTKVAVANPAKVFNEIQETKDLKQAMENKRKTLEAQRFEKEQRIKELQALRDQLKSDAPQYGDRNRDLLQATMDYQVWGQMMQADVQSEQKRQMLHIFTKIANATAKVATARGIDIVIAEQRPEFPENTDQLNVDQIRSMINSKNILFAADKSDITNEVIAEMDKDYKSGAPSK